MTKRRYDNHSTEFGLWLREQNEIDSYWGYKTTNIDYVWKNAATDKFILIEEKRYLSMPYYFQRYIFHVLDELCKKDNNYKGFYLLIFEKTNPEDGKIYLTKLSNTNWNNPHLKSFRKEISKKELISFLKLDWNNSYE